MKFKTTQKAIRENYSDIIRVSYCSLQHLLYCVNPVAYTIRAEGWGCDVYTIGNVAISTGYAPFGNIVPKYETVRKYDDAAQAIAYNHHISYDERREQLNELIRMFIAEVTPD